MTKVKRQVDGLQNPISIKSDNKISCPYRKKERKKNCSKNCAPREKAGQNLKQTVNQFVSAS